MAIRLQAGACFFSRCAAAALLLGLACTPALAARVGIAAIVNDEVISTADLADRRELLLALNGLPSTPENQAKVTRKVLQSLIEDQLELQEARRQSQSVSDDEITKALATMATARGGAPGSLQQLIKDKNLSLPSMKKQLRAQLSWNKVVQHKLRRNVSISQDEIARAQTAQATGPGTPELRMAALSIPVTDANVAEVSAMATDIARQLKSGATMSQLVTQYGPSHRVTFTPPAWVPEDSLQPALQQALRDLQPGQNTPPLRSANSFQIMQLMDRQMVKPLPDATEIALKQIAVPVPAARDKDTLAKLELSVKTLHDNPGSCEDASLPGTALPAQVKYARTKVGQLGPEQRSIINHLDVGQVSDPIFTPQSVQLVLLCEKVETPGNLPDAETVRQQLYSEKLELEAQKLLRNLKRDAFIDIKTDDSSS